VRLNLVSSVLVGFRSRISDFVDKVFLTSLDSSDFLLILRVVLLHLTATNPHLDWRLSGVKVTTLQKSKYFSKGRGLIK
jgi:hypothetical protein